MYNNSEFNRWRRHPWHGLRARKEGAKEDIVQVYIEKTPDDVCLLYTSPSPRDRTRSRMPSSA